MPLHKGADGFLSGKDFEELYWPTLKAVIVGLIEEGLVPQLFVEGSFNDRLDVVVDDEIPAGRTIWLFDATDMAAVRDRFRGYACFGGNVPGALLSIGTPAEVDDYVRRPAGGGRGRRRLHPQHRGRRRRRAAGELRGDDGGGAPVRRVTAAARPASRPPAETLRPQPAVRQVRRPLLGARGAAAR